MLQELPNSISSVGGAAKVLDASNNKLAALPPSLAELVNLQRLILSNNALTSLHSLEPLKKLKVTFSPTQLLLKL